MNIKRKLGKFRHCCLDSDQPFLSWQSSESRCLQRLKITTSQTEGEANNDPSDQTMTPGPELGNPGIGVYSYFQQVLTSLLAQVE